MPKYRLVVQSTRVREDPNEPGRVVSGKLWPLDIPDNAKIISAKEVGFAFWDVAYLEPVEDVEVQANSA